MSIMRSAFLWASTHPILAEKLPRMGFVQRAARRFMPGETKEAAYRAAEELQADGASSILTLLGENVTSRDEAAEVVEHYRGVMEDVRERGLEAEVSVKLTQLGLDIDTETALEHVRTLAEVAGDALLWIDMESSAYVDRTLEVFRTVREERDNVGVCLQAYLHRTPDDLEALLPLEPAIRLVKGAYREDPDVAIERKREVDAAYTRLATRLLRAANAGSVGRVAIATHDPRMINHALTRVHELELEPGAWEVEMLYGIGREQQRRILRGKTQLRVLISYGSNWFPWYMRRLAERPANVWFVLRKLIGG